MKRRCCATTRWQTTADALHRLARAAKAGAIPGGSIEDGTLKIDRLTAAVPEQADALNGKSPVAFEKIAA